MLFWKVKNLNPAQGFEHVKGYAGLAAGKLGVAANISKRTINCLMSASLDVGRFPTLKPWRQQHHCPKAKMTYGEFNAALDSACQEDVSRRSGGITNCNRMSRVVGLGYQ